MGGQGIGVRGGPGSIPGGITPFDGVSFKCEREDYEKVLHVGLINKCSSCFDVTLLLKYPEMNQCIGI